MSKAGPIFVTGATGFLGARLCDQLAAAGTVVRALSRHPAEPAQAAARSGLVWVQGDPASDAAGAPSLEPAPWQRALAGASAVIHLAGEPIAARRWSPVQKQRLYESRVHSTRRIVAALESCEHKPAVLVCASATGYYGPRGEEELDERSSPGTDFLARLCQDWEQAAATAERLGVRVVSLRFGVILGAAGGALARMQLPFRLGLGGPLGPPKRWFPWIHEDDALGLIRFAVAGGLSGAVNVTAPGLVRQSEFARALGQAMRRPSLIPMPLALLRIALGEMAEGLVPGQRVIPRAAQQGGYAFCHPELSGALAASLGKPVPTAVPAA